MWNCPKCDTEVQDQFDNCPKCGAGRDGSEAPVDFVRKDDAYQPGLPAASDSPTKSRTRLVEVLIVLVVITTLVIIAFRH